MKIFAGLVLYVYLIRDSIAENAGEEFQGPLLQIQTVIRHASRSSVETYLDGSLDHNPMDGFILPSGLRMTYQLGKLFRKDYIQNEKFIPPEYNEQIEGASSDRGRCFETLQSFFLGLYPFGKGPILPTYNPDIFLIPPYADFQGHKRELKQEEQLPIVLPERFSVFPFTILPRSTDIILLGALAKVCHPFTKLIQQMEHTQTAYRIKRYLQTTFQVFKHQFNWTKPEDIILYDVSRMVDQVFVDIYELNYRVPDFMTQNSDLFREMYFTYIICHHIELFQQKTLQKRMSMTPFFKMVIARMDLVALQNKTSDGRGKKAFFYVGSQVTVAGVLQYLNYSNHECIEKVFNGTFNSQKEFCIYEYPIFSSNFIFEIRKDIQTGTPFVKLRYNGKYLPVCSLQTFSCIYTQWRKTVLDYTYQGYYSYCHQQPIFYPRDPLPDPTQQSLDLENLDKQKHSNKLLRHQFSEELE